ncbi:hypothetical protein TcasGA2_TC002111 [Tribolium castaneum]|uniref:Uncharacterized protein n=1 Tax=Tribolium castaneum TaxID=7070 RepID=D6WGU0_TRICA|nr:hypothetical protein TcasGA2_TC002111 [Tribolium castaneum]
MINSCIIPNLPRYQRQQYRKRLHPTIPGYNASSNNETKKALNPPFLVNNNPTRHSQRHCQHITTVVLAAAFIERLHTNDALGALKRRVGPSPSAPTNWRKEYQKPDAEDPRLCEGRSRLSSFRGSDVTFGRDRERALVSTLHHPNYALFRPNRKFRIPGDSYFGVGVK